MQKAFNKTIIKLQNTSRIAEEQVSAEGSQFPWVWLHRPLVATPAQSLVVDVQDQRQTESIQLLQGQLENVTQLVVNLSVRVSQLQIEVNTKSHAQWIHAHAARQQRWGSRGRHLNPDQVLLLRR